MTDGTDYELFENEAIDGRVFLQYLSGEPSNQFKLECLPQLCCFRGRFKLTSGSRIRYENFEFSLDQGRIFDVSSPVTREELGRIPPYIEARKTTVLKATDFPYHFPAESITLVLINGDTSMHSDVPGKCTTKNVTLTKVVVEFRRKELITLPNSYGYEIAEVLFDKMTLLRGRLTIPRPHSFNVDVYLDHSTPSSSFRSRSFSPSTFRAVSASRSYRSSGPRESIWSRIYRLNLAIEFFIFFLVLLLWLLFRSYYVNDQNYYAFTVYSVLFVAVSAVAIFTFRGYVLKTLARTLSPAEINGRSFFVNGWNAWSFCGVVLQGQPPPVYSMPGLFVRAFHDGGLGTSLRINLGQGEAPPQPNKDRNPGWWNRLLCATDKHTVAAKDHVASDMFTVLSDARANYGVVLGFLSQREQFGCIATNAAYDRVSVHVSGDGTLIPSGGSIETDWLCIYTLDTLCEPFKVYMAMSSAENEVYKKLACVRPPVSRAVSANSSFGRPGTRGIAGTKMETVTLPEFTLTTADCAVEEVRLSGDGSLLLDEHLLVGNDRVVDGRPPLSITIDKDGKPQPQPPSAVSPQLERRLGQAIPAGWCSWYHFYEHISDRVLANNLDFMQQFRQRRGLSHSRQGFSLFQVDDGYQAAWGDWGLINSAKFPSQTLTPLVQRVRDAGLTPGLWLAPFSCDKHSSVAKRHPEWVLKRNGSTTVPSNSANCGKFFYGLDTTHPEVQQHIQESIEVAAHVWGFAYLKLDFLYSAVLADAHDSHFDRTLTNAQIMQQALRLVTETAGKDVFVLGCGAPLGSLVGHVHANRVSADAGLSWNPEFPLPAGDKWNLPSARNCVRNTLTRLFMHKQWWINDPDCLMLRDKLVFTDDEIRGMATAKALSAGSFVISDDLQMISNERFRIAQQLLPPARDAAVAVDLLERETPELFRMQLRSNYAHWLLEEGDLELSSDASTPRSPVAASPASGSGYWHTAALAALANLDGGARGGSVRGEGSDHESSRGMSRATSGSLQALVSSPQLARKHSQQRGLIFKAGSDLDLVRKERRKLRNFLKEENAMNESDLIGEFTLFTVCNWGDAPQKNHFVSVKRIFGEEYVETLLAQKTLLDNLLKVQLSRGTSRGEKGDGHHSRAGKSPTARDVRSRDLRSLSFGLRVTPEKGGRPRLSESPRYVLHLFNFWTETYYHRVVSLDDGHASEVAFLHIPKHSAHIYAASLTTDPTLPKYIGSNLHFTCGNEVRRAYMTTPSFEAETLLRGVVYDRLLREQDEPFLSRVEEGHWEGEAGQGGTDFAFGFGFGENAGGDAGPSARRATSCMDATQSGQGRGGLYPVVRSMYISFEAGALRDAAWGGFIWVYLPVNGLNPRMAERSMGKIHLSGPVWESSAGAVQISGVGPPSAHVDAEVDETAAFLPKRTSVSSAGVQERSRQAHTVQLVSRVAAPECKIYGDVYRISVAAAKTTEPAQSSSVPLAAAVASGVAGTAGDGAYDGSDGGREYLVVSWVFDVRDAAPSPNVRPG